LKPQLHKGSLSREGLRDEGNIKNIVKCDYSSDAINQGLTQNFTIDTNSFSLQV